MEKGTGTWVVELVVCFCLWFCIGGFDCWRPSRGLVLERLGAVDKARSGEGGDIVPLTRAGRLGIVFSNGDDSGATAAERQTGFFWLLFVVMGDVKLRQHRWHRVRWDIKGMVWWWWWWAADR